jgi:hypothetical protein
MSMVRRRPRPAPVGLWAVVSPWVLGFAGSMPVMAVHVIGGLVVAIPAGVELYLASHRPFSAV